MIKIIKRIKNVFFINYYNNFFKKNIWAVKKIKKPRGRNYYYILSTTYDNRADHYLIHALY